MKIELINVSKKINDNLILDNISHIFESCKIHGIFARNKVGKTTLLNLICKKYPLSTGSILYDGKTMDNCPLSICCAFKNENKGINIFKSVKAHILSEALFYDNFDITYAFELTKLFNIDLKKRAYSLSQGHYTLLQNIIVLASNAKILIFDEPVLGVDASNRELFYKELIKLYLKQEANIFISTHLIDELQLVINDFIIINDSKIIYSNDVDNINESLEELFINLVGGETCE